MANAPDDTDPGPPPRVVRDLVRAVAADPRYLAERLTLHTLTWWGPRAGRSVEAIRRKLPEADAEGLRQAVQARTVRTCMVEGSFLGGPFMALLPVAFCAALLAQIRMILELAALSGRAPTEPVRAAEVLVIQGVHPDVPTAQAALRTAAARTKADDGGRRPGLKELGTAVWRMSRLLGITAPESEHEQPGTVKRIANWAALIGTFLVGMVIPLIWMPYLALGYRRGTLDVARRANAAYLGSGGPIRREDGGHVVPFMTGAVGRALVGIVATAVLTVVLFIINVAFAGNRWASALVILVLAAAVTGGIWYARHRRAERARQGQGT